MFTLIGWAGAKPVVSAAPETEQCELVFAQSPANHPEAHQTREIERILGRIFPNFLNEKFANVDRGLIALLRADLATLNSTQQRRYFEGLRMTKVVDKLDVDGDADAVFWPKAGFIEQLRNTVDLRLGRYLFVHERRHLLDSILKPNWFTQRTLNPLRAAMVEWRAQRDVYRLVKTLYARPELLNELRGSLMRESVLRQFLGLKPPTDIPAASVVKSGAPFATLMIHLRDEVAVQKILTATYVLGTRVGATYFLRRYRGQILAEARQASYAWIYLAVETVSGWIRKVSPAQGRFGF